MIAVVGAGLCGVTAARVLASRGEAVTVYEKSPRVGGRMATRRVTRPDGRDAHFDHGCQYLTATTPEFSDFLAGLHAAGVVAPWDDPPRGLTPQAPHGESGESGEAFVGVGGMRKVVEHLAAGLTVVTGTRVTRLARTDDQWALTLDGGDTAVARELVLTLPVPQSLELLFASGIGLPRGVLSRLREVEYTRSLAVLSPSRESPRPALPRAVDWVGDNHAKGTSAAPAWTVLLSAAASESGWDADPDSTVTAALGGVPAGAQVHRWRYCRPAGAYPERRARVDDLGLTLAGDGFGSPGGTAEAAYLSGLAAGVRAGQ